MWSAIFNLIAYGILFAPLVYKLITKEAIQDQESDTSLSIILGRFLPLALSLSLLIASFVTIRKSKKNQQLRTRRGIFTGVIALIVAFLGLFYIFLIDLYYSSFISTTISNFFN
jgi:hypothetical protein